MSSVSFANKHDHAGRRASGSPATPASSTSRRTRSCWRTTRRATPAARPRCSTSTSPIRAARSSSAARSPVDGHGAGLGRRQRPLEPRLRRRQDRARDRRRHSGCNGGYVLSTVDFSNPDAPVLDVGARHPVRPGWSAAARFDTNRLYLSPPSSYYDGSARTPFQVYDLTDPTAPRAGRHGRRCRARCGTSCRRRSSRLFALGNDYARERRRLGLAAVPRRHQPGGAACCSAPRRSARAGRGRRRPARSRRSRWTRPRASSCCRSPAGTTPRQPTTTACS